MTPLSGDQKDGVPASAKTGPGGSFGLASVATLSAWLASTIANPRVAAPFAGGGSEEADQDFFMLAPGPGKSPGKTSRPQNVQDRIKTG